MSLLLLQQAGSAGQLAVVRPNYLCVQGSRSLAILDPRTGLEFWKLDGLSSTAQIVGHREALFVVNPGKNEAFAYRAMDGKPIEIPGLARLLSDALLTHGSSLLLFEQGGANSSGGRASKRTRTSKSTLKLYDPVARLTTWKMEFPAGTVVSPLGQNEIIAVQPDWQMRRIDVATGRSTSLEAPFAEAIASTKSGHLFEKTLIADHDRIYLIINRMENNPQAFAESLASIRVNGWIFAWNLPDNQFLWHNAVKDQNLVVDRFSASPVLLCVSRSWRARRGIRGLRTNLGSLVISAIHKQTGQKLIDRNIPAAYSAFHALSIDVESRSLELKSYNARLRLVSTEDHGVAETPRP